MTSRQRILAALNRRPVDRVPIDPGGTRQSGISAFACARLRRRVRRNLNIVSPGGGYVFASAHNIQADVPADNILALFDAVLSYKGQ